MRCHRQSSLNLLFRAAACLALGTTLTSETVAGQPDVVAAFERFGDDARLAAATDVHGNGSFGRWIADAAGLPAYEYTMDQTRDAGAAYFVAGGTSRDHWHMLGNDRIVATAHNGGYVQLYDWTRGPKIVNRWAPDERNYAGGFKFVTVDEQTFNTLWEHLPDGATQRRVFGMGYFQKVTRHAGLTLTERIEAPAGDDPALLSATVIENGRPGPVDLAVTEFWDVNLHQLTAAIAVTSKQIARFQRQRSALNRKFVMDAAWDASNRILSVSLSSADPRNVPGPDEPATQDHHPKTVCLAPLDELPDDYKAFAVDQDLFFGQAGIDRPPGLTGAADGRLFADRTAYGGKAVLAMRRTIHLAPGQRKQLSYLYAYADKHDLPDLVARHKKRSQRPSRPLLELTVPDAPWLGRELMWHSYVLQAGAMYQDYYQSHLVDQGSAYGYLQGGTGAHRDFALFTLPMVYIRPDLAKEMLRFSMRSQSAKTGGLPYVHLGHGRVSDAVIHGRNSDLDLFFLWALSEYLAATQDRAFLDESLPFYPPTDGRSGTVLEHARAAFRHLVDRVRVGEHGVILCGTGDWNDELISLSPKRVKTMMRGESSLNAGLATVALPAMAAIVEPADAKLAADMRAFADGQAKALRSLWVGEWVARGYIGDGDTMLGRDRLFLDAQPFGVLGGVWNAEQLAVLFKRIHADCVAAQPAGALSMSKPVTGPGLEPGSDTNGGTWAAIDSWVAWAWSKVDAKAAWNFYLTTTLAAKAQAYPDIWYGIWSGPDSYNAHYHSRPGETFLLNFAAMVDFPVMNMNRHAGPLIDAIKLAGIEPRGDLIVIDPRMPTNAFVLRTPLIGLAYLPDRHRGYYTPIVDGRFRFAVRPPANVNPQRASLTINDRLAKATPDDHGLLRFDVPAKADAKIRWEIKQAKSK